MARDFALSCDLRAQVLFGPNYGHVDQWPKRNPSRLIGPAQVNDCRFHLEFLFVLRLDLYNSKLAREAEEQFNFIMLESFECITERITAFVTVTVSKQAVLPTHQQAVLPIRRQTLELKISM